jgi:hypothetical protein
MGLRRANGVDSPRGNRLLAALSEKDYGELLPSLEPVEMPLGQSLYESGGVQGYVYFPTSCIVSLLYVLEDGSSAAAAKAWWASRYSWAARPRRAGDSEKTVRARRRPAATPPASSSFAAGSCSAWTGCRRTS